MSKIVINQLFCKGCKLCIETCPQQLIEIATDLNAAGYHTAEFNDIESICTGCTLCALMCPDSAIEVYRDG